jgi:uncharacterized protein YktA (UPF0223 family)
MSRYDPVGITSIGAAGGRGMYRKNIKSLKSDVKLPKIKNINLSDVSNTEAAVMHNRFLKQYSTTNESPRKAKGEESESQRYFDDDDDGYSAFAKVKKAQSLHEQRMKPKESPKKLKFQKLPSLSNNNNNTNTNTNANTNTTSIKIENKAISRKSGKISDDSSGIGQTLNDDHFVDINDPFLITGNAKPAVQENKYLDHKDATETSLAIKPKPLKVKHAKLKFSEPPIEVDEFEKKENIRSTNVNSDNKSTEKKAPSNASGMLQSHHLNRKCITVI